MKKRNFVVAFVFILAVGSAAASEYLIEQTAFSSKDDIETQVGNCVQRGTCSGDGSPCSIIFDPDGVGGLPNQAWPMYDGTLSDKTVCGVRLNHTN